MRQEGSEMELTWSKQMSVGNGTLDSEHMVILDLVKNIIRVIKEKDNALFSQALKQLEDATHKHFEHEELIAKEIHFSFEEHNLEHQYILGEFLIIKDELAESQGRWSESLVEHYLEFLITWAIDHIIEDDMKMKPFLERFPYDYKPDGLMS